MIWPKIISKTIKSILLIGKGNSNNNNNNYNNDDDNNNFNIDNSCYFVCECK